MLASQLSSKLSQINWASMG